MTDIKSLIEHAENWVRTTEFIANPWIEELIAALRDATDERLAALQSYVSASETIDRLAAENAAIRAERDAVVAECDALNKMRDAKIEELSASIKSEAKWIALMGEARAERGEMRIERDCLAKRLQEIEDL